MNRHARSPVATPMIESPLAQLTDEQIEELGKRVRRDPRRGLRRPRRPRPALHHVSMIEMHRRLVVLGRVLLLRLALQAGLGRRDRRCSPLAKILENMEIGHNVMHGQWDWMNDPQIHSSTWDWDSASTAEAWKHSHNYVHHTYTNIRGKDKDLGYEIMRIDPHQKWHPVYLLQPFYNLVADGAVRVGRRLPRPRLRGDPQGREVRRAAQRELKGMAGKARLQITKDYIAFPLVLGGDRGRRRRGDRRACGARAARAARRARARLERGARHAVDVARERSWHAEGRRHREHRPQRVGATRSSSAATSPTRPTRSARTRSRTRRAARFYVRQLLGAANIEGSPLFHVISGNLGYQVEHHLYPDMPSTRYARDRAAGARTSASATSCPTTPGRSSKQLGHGAAHDPAPRLPRRQAARRSRGPTGARTATPARRPTATAATARRAATAPGPSSSSDGVRVSMPDED